MSYKYRDFRTSLNGITKWLILYLGVKRFDELFRTYGDLNHHLKQIRLLEEPNKLVSKNAEINAIYIQKNYNFNVVTSYFKEHFK